MFADYLANMDQHRAGAGRAQASKSATEVLASAGLPADALERTGLLFFARNLRRAGSWRRHSHTIKPYLFHAPRFDGTSRVKPGCEAEFIEVVNACLAGTTTVVRYSPHVAAMRALGETVRAERASRQAALLNALWERMPAMREPRPQAEQETAARFLQEWKAASAGAGTSTTHHPGGRTLFADGTRALLAAGLDPFARERFLARLKPTHFVDRLFADDDPLSGLWVFERPVLGKGLLIRTALCLRADEPPRCELFADVRAEMRPVQQPMPLCLAESAAHPMELTVEGATVPTRLIAQQDERTGQLYSTTVDDQRNTTATLNRLRSLRVHPMPEDWSDFRANWTGMQCPHLEQVLKWPAGRWRELERGAFATEREAAVWRRLADPEWLLELLAHQFPDLYASTAPECWRSGVVNLSLPIGPGPIMSAWPPDVFSGFTRPHLNRFGTWANVVCEALKPTWDEFWLLMFLGDMEHYRLYGRGLTGIRYKATATGPQVPDAEPLLRRLCDERILTFSWKAHGQGTSAPRVGAHPFFYPADFPAYWRAEEILKALGLDKRTWAPSVVRKACIQAPNWPNYVASGDWLSYDLAYELRG